MRILIVDDVEEDAMLMGWALKHDGLIADWHRVDNEEALRASLKDPDPDVILCDHSMPSFDSHAVLKIVGALKDPPPVIIVSGQIGEENLTIAFHEGATDYVNKDHLKDLLARAVIRAVAARSARRELEEAAWRLRRAEKTAALRTYVAGVAHEINNPLSYMIMGSELAQDTLDRLRTEADPVERLRQINEVVECIESITRGCQRIATIAYGIQRVAKSAQRPRVRVYANTLVEDALRDAPDGVSIVRDLACTREVLVDTEDLREALRGILRNAFEAGEGRPASPVTVATHDHGTGVRIEIIDRGVGIPRELHASVFMPFFTSKHRGMGLSLSIAQRLVEDHGGSLTFESIPGEGSTFRIDLPDAAA